MLQMRFDQRQHPLNSISAKSRRHHNIFSHLVRGQRLKRLQENNGQSKETTQAKKIPLHVWIFRRNLLQSEGLKVACSAFNLITH